MKAIERVLDKLYALVMFICKIALIADILITSYAVAGRYVGKYIPLTSLDEFLPKKLCQVLDIFADVLILAFSIIMIYEGFNTATTVGSRVKYATLPALSKFWMYAGVPIAGIVICIFILEALAKDVKKLSAKEDK